MTKTRISPSKGILCSIVCSFILFLDISTAHAQSSICTESIVISELDPVQSARLKAGFTGWMYPGLGMQESFGNFPIHGISMFQDSTVVWGTSSSTFGMGTHGVGSVFDPTDQIFELVGDYTRLSRFNAYVVDSLLIRYYYTRYIDSFDFGQGLEEVIDTLIIQFFVKDDLSFETLNQTTGEVYAKPKSFNVENATSNHYSYQLKIPLDSSHATQLPGYHTADPDDNARYAYWWNIPIPEFEIPSNQDLDGSNVFGWYMTFRTALPFEAGDTLEHSADHTINRKLNYFGTSYFHNHGEPFQQIDNYNNSFWVRKSLRYGNTVNGYSGYIPGTDSAEGSYLRYQLHIRTDNLGVEEQAFNGNIKVYPNPALGNEPLFIELTLDEVSDVTILVKDSYGNELTKEIKPSLHSGEHIFQMDASGLAAGTYTYHIQTNSGSVSKTFFIVN